MPDEWMVYSLVCEIPDDVEKSARSVSYDGRFPKWAREAQQHETVIYVGVTPDGGERISDHFQGEGAWFTQTFPPTEVHQVKFYDDEQRAKSGEVAMASRLRDEFGREVTYVYQN